MPLFDSSSVTTTTAPATRPSRWSFDLFGSRPADLFDAWLFAEADATLALGAWQSAEDQDKPDAYAAYVAALDREAHAAAVLERRLGPGR
ncbi:MAG: hypothetical protein QOE86_2415 [Solirubrobacteraceae bacterium]|jgi:hypothetical protein|nr:hypothetical protein [Solirubrobacteraceae bacterium]